MLAQDLVLLSADDLEKNGVRDKRESAAIADVLAMKVASHGKAVAPAAQPHDNLDMAYLGHTTSNLCC